jgi:hypothetical protein
VNNEFSDPATVTIHVVPDPNRAPVGIPDAFGTPSGMTLTVPAPGLIANDFDPDGDTFILSNFFQPSNGTITSIVTNGSFVYVPDAGFAGTDTFVYVARDVNNEFSDPVTVTIEVVPAGGSRPVAIADAYATPENTTLTVAAPDVEVALQQEGQGNEEDQREHARGGYRPGAKET